MLNLKNAGRVVGRILPWVIGLAILSPAPWAGATGVQPNVREGSDIVMKDMRWPFWDQGTYFCFWYVTFAPKMKNNPTFYGGLATKGAENLPGMFVSYWGDIVNIHEGEQVYRHGYGAEGSKGGANSRPDFLRPNAWYRHVLRVFPPAQDADAQTYVGWWVKDVEKNQWHTHSVISIDRPATGVQGNGGFVESLAPETIQRAFERRLGYCRVEGQWFKSATIVTGSPKLFKLIEGDTVLRYDRSAPDGSEAGAKVEVTTKQPDTPTLDAPGIAKAAASAHGKQVVVQWGIPAGAAPQLGYRLEVFADAAAKGEPLAAFADVAPHVLAKRLDMEGTPKSVRLTVTDIFDQQASVTIPVKRATPGAAKNVSKLRPGLKYDYYEAPQGAAWERLPDFAALKPLKQGIVKTTDDTIREERDKLYAMQYRGYLQAPETGLYVLELGTCDGGRLRIDGRAIANNDGVHSTSVKQHPVALDKGLHAFELSYFKGSASYLADKILLSWEGPGFGPRKLAPTDFVCEDRAGIPSIAMPTGGVFAKGVLDDNLVEIQPKIESRGRRIAKVQFYRDRLLLGTVVNDAPSGAGDLTFRNLLPAGENQLWARLWYDGGNSVDSDVLPLQAKNKTADVWTFDDFGEKFPLAVRSHEGQIAFRGEGFCFGRRAVSGDFTLTARVAELGLRTAENGFHNSNWLGLYVQEGLKGPFNGKRFGVYCLANGTVKGAADYPDLAGSYVGLPSFPPDHRWLRLVRDGPRFLAFTSADGKTWRKAMERVLQTFKKDAHAGVVFRAVPGKSRSLYQGAFDNVTLTPDVPEAAPRQPIREADRPRFGQVTAIVQAGKPSGALYARTIGKGLLQSTDGGENWRPANAGLTAPDALAVRSVAVHPTDASVVLRGSGCVADGKLKSGLFRSADGGKTWRRVSEAIDFDGRGPTTIFGETIAFCLENPRLVAAAGETKGLFLSQDAGATWQYAGYAGERITCLAFVPETKGAAETLVVGTFDDREFKALGLGQPVSPVDAPGRVYWLKLSEGVIGKNQRPCGELEDFGVANLGFGAHENFATFATTRGVFYTWERGNMFCQRRYELPADTFYAALGHRQFKYDRGNGDWRMKSTTFAAPFSGTEPSPVYCAPERTTFKWSLLSGKARIDGDDAALSLNVGITCILADRDDANAFYLCNRHGIFKTTDLGKSFRLSYKCAPGT